MAETGMSKRDPRWFPILEEMRERALSDMRNDIHRPLFGNLPDVSESWWQRVRWRLAEWIAPGPFYRDD